MNKQPERTAQTRQNIIDAFWEIGARRGIDKVTISEITKKANLNRGTFYVYFSSMEELLREAEGTIVSAIKKEMEYALSNLKSLTFQDLSAMAMAAFDGYGDKLYMLLGEHGDPSFLELAREELAPVFSARIQGIAPYQDYLVTFVFSAFIGLFQFWIKGGKRLPLAQLSDFVYKMVYQGVSGFLTGENDQNVSLPQN